MDIRRVQITGGSSYTISLPKDWIRSQSIIKNSPVGLDIQKDGTVMVYPKVDDERIEKSKVFDMDNIDEGLTFRMLLGAYLMGYSSIRLISSKGITDTVLDQVMAFTQKAIGPEIIDEDENTIIIKDLLNPSKMPFEKTLERMYIIVRYMHHDTVNAITNAIKDPIDDITARDLEVDRLNWLMAHQYNIINTSVIPHSMKISKEKAEFYFVAGRIVERIGDHAVQIASNSKLIGSDRYCREIRDAISKASNFSIGMLDSAINSWYNTDIKMANDTIERASELHDLSDRIDELSLGSDRDIALPIGRMADSIRRTGDYSTDISENVINYLIRDL